VKGHEDVKEIPRQQRYVGRPPLSEIVKKPGDRRERTKSVQKAVIEYGYTLKEVADYLGIHYSTVSRAVGRKVHARNKT
jgi:putative transposase